MKAEDRDYSAKLKYSIKGGDKERNFIIEENSGILKLQKNLDRETVEKQELLIEAIDTDNFGKLFIKYTLHY